MSFRHKTATEFLLRSADVPRSPVGSGIYEYKGCLDLVGANRYLAEICVVYLTLDDAVSDGSLSDHGTARKTTNFDVRGPNDEDWHSIENMYRYLLTYQNTRRYAGLFDYAAMYWGAHCRLGNISPSDDAIFTKAIILCNTSTFRDWFQKYWVTITATRQFPDRLTPLMVAAHMGLPGVIYALLSADGNGKNKGSPILTSTTTQSRTSHLQAAESEGRTVLHWAVWNGHGSLINNTALKLLLQQLNDDDYKDSTDRNPHESDWHDNYESKPDQHCPAVEVNTRVLDIKDNEGLTPLHWAAAFDQTGAVRLLLEAGADDGAVNNKGMTPLKLAYEQESIGAAEVLLKYRDHPEQAYNEPGKDVGHSDCDE